MLEPSVLNSALKYLEAVKAQGIPVEHGVVFGSQATGHAHFWSDIDILVISPHFDGMRDRSGINLLWRLAARIDSRLEPLQPVSLELAHTPGLRRHVGQLLAHYHYRGFHGAVGENVQYLVKDVRGRELAVMVFGAAAWKVAVRDRFIGWSVAQRQARLGRLANQQRFLILPWVRVAHLASHLLALVTQRLSRDWQARYGHPVWLVETFVELDRFAGTCYQAAGWLSLGQTTGRTRQDRQRTLQSPRKSVWVRPLHPAFRQHLTAP